MRVNCPSCGRSFELDPERARTFRSARCTCGAAIDLRASSGGTRLGKYLLQERIAVGGMGEIYRATMAGIEGFQRDVAIKKMLPHLSADRDFVAMLVNEAKLTVLLHHPNIVQVYDLAREGDEYFIAMEYVPSVNLSALLEFCALGGVYTPVPVAVSVTLQTLEALGYAHTLAGADGRPMHLLHRDVTPQNILVTRDGWVKVTDFGIAKAKNEISTTRPGTIRGKLGYLAPEQLQGGEADQRVDIFCAGIVLWEALATRRLFKGNDEADTLRRILAAEVPSLGAIRGDVTPALEAVVARALARDPAGRHATAAAFRDALLAAIAPATADDYLKATKRFFAERAELFDRAPAGATPVDAPTVTVAAPAPERAESAPVADLLSRPRRRTPWPVVVVVVALAAMAAAAGAWWSSRRPARSPAPSAAVAAPAPGAAARAADASRPLGPEEIRSTVTEHFASIATCLTRLASAPDTVTAHLTIAASGRVTSVALAPKLDSPEATRCLVTTIKSIPFRAAPRGVEVTIPLRVQRYTSGN